MSKHCVAVYGTLKQGRGNHRLLEHCPVYATGLVEGFRLYARGIPYLVEDKDNTDYKVSVELYKVDDETLARLDRLEGHPEFYTRKVIPVAVSGQLTDAWIYTYPRPCGEEIVTGVY